MSQVCGSTRLEVLVLFRSISILLKHLYNFRSIRIISKHSHNRNTRMSSKNSHDFKFRIVCVNDRCEPVSGLRTPGATIRFTLDGSDPSDENAAPGVVQIYSKTM
jgi:hypothetical protein